MDSTEQDQCFAILSRRWIGIGIGIRTCPRGDKTFVDKNTVRTARLFFLVPCLYKLG